jgi:uncharacterized protein YndB with AHSA1/START domain
VHAIEMKQHFGAPPAAVFAAVTDHVGMSRWLEGTQVALEREGEPRPNGLGALRRVRARGVTVCEEVVRWEEPTAMDYKIVRGSPLRDHLGEVRLRPTADGGTDLDYRIRFAVPWYFGGALLGGFLARQLGKEIQAGLTRLASQLADG